MTSSISRESPETVQTSARIISFLSIFFHTGTNTFNKQLLDEVEHDIMNYQNRGLCYLSKPKAEADNTDTRF